MARLVQREALDMVQSTTRLAVADRDRPDVLRTLRVLGGHTASKSGCLGFHVAEDVTTAGVFIVTEWWATRDDLDAHIRSAEYRLLLAVIDLAARPPDIRFDLVEPLGGLDVVFDVRSKGAARMTRMKGQDAP